MGPDGNFLSTGTRIRSPSLNGTLPTGLIAADKNVYITEDFFWLFACDE